MTAKSSQKRDASPGTAPPATEWKHCYETGWKGLIVPEAFAHPAKFSRSLIERIYDHMLARGYIKKGDVIGDPFGGIGTGGIMAAYRDLRWIGVELEPKFVDLAKKNFELHRWKWERLGLPEPIIFKGDSRQFNKHVAAVVSSPPYCTREDGCGIAKNGDTSKSTGGKSLGRSCPNCAGWHMTKKAEVSP